MYLNITTCPFSCSTFERLTLTLDVFKLSLAFKEALLLERLTLTLDVFKWTRKTK